jgi:hypothetical protein
VSTVNRRPAPGLITRRYGSGTSVNSVRLVQSLHRNVGTDQLIRSKGRVPGIAEMAWRRIDADQAVASCLDLEVGTPVIDRELGPTDCEKIFHSQAQIYALYCGCELRDASCVAFNTRPRQSPDPPPGSHRDTSVQRKDPQE